MSILLSSFEAFAGMDRNPSMNLADDLGFESIVLPVSYKRSFEILKNKIESTHRPKYLVQLGLAQKRTKISIERLAANLSSASLPDSDGVVLQNAPILENGPPALATTLSQNELETLVDDHCAVSDDCGHYVCNSLYYKTLFEYPDIKTVFIHVPMPLDWGSKASLLKYKQILKSLQTNLNTLAFKTK